MSESRKQRLLVFLLIVAVIPFVGIPAFFITDALCTSKNEKFSRYSWEAKSGTTVTFSDDGSFAYHFAGVFQLGTYEADESTLSFNVESTIIPSYPTHGTVLFPLKGPAVCDYELDDEQLTFFIGDGLYIEFRGTPW